ncbi:hypothetical protein [Sneathiella aquimaris]|uniref:hypothetical protein n=1 Tax=Sneathiella aquimaris TaxID=2599305 RepID=UPI00146E3CA4|nr:hypothetical protein [Sneathiella aquimaris]
MVRKLSLSEYPDWPRMMSKSTAAAYLDVSIATFEKYVPVESLPFGSRALYDREELDQFVSGLTNRGPIDLVGSYMEH